MEAFNQYHRLIWDGPSSLLKSFECTSCGCQPVNLADTLGIPAKKLKHLAEIQDVAHLTIDSELFFRVAALEEWATRNESKA